MADDSILIQVQLGSPTRANINAVTRQIQSALSNVSANVQIQNGRQAAQTHQNIKSKTDAATKSTTSFAEAIGLSGRRFIAFTSAVAVVGRLTSALSQATREAIKFEREFVKLSQVFDTDVRSLRGLQNSLSDVSKEFGLSATVVAKTSVVLAQSGLTARQTEQAMRTLAKTTLAATFDSIAASTEGAVAIMAQFGTEASKLESQLGAINAVSKKFAVESGDIIEAVRRAGGAFRAAGGNLNEFIALFTSVRSTTRESAETIATGFRTIFARLQRPKTIDFFRQLNIELSDGQGNFIGAFEAVKRLSKGLNDAGIKAGSLKFASVVEQLGGIRQVSRVIPLLQKFSKAELARQVAIAGAGSLDADAAKAQETLAQSFARTTENFRALIREISQTSTFQAIVKIALGLANAFIEVARSLKPLIPLITALASIRLGGLLSGALRSGIGGSGGTGGLGKGFKRGGPVPGTGSGDTVPAMLEPGEFVIRKSAVQAFGTDRLSKINKYATGGNIARKDTTKGFKNKIVKDPGEAYLDGRIINEKDKFSSDIKRISYSNNKIAQLLLKIRQPGKRRQYLKDLFPIKEGSKKSGIKGRAFEELLVNDNLGRPIKGRNSPMDFRKGAGYGEAKFTKTPIGKEILYSKAIRQAINDKGYSRLKQTPSMANDKIKLPSITLHERGSSVQKSIVQNILEKQERKLRKKELKKKVVRRRALGGSISGAGTDTVPALLTPGEFVINKKSAESYGYGNLGKINKYAKGGPVQRFANAGRVEDSAKSLNEMYVSQAITTGEANAELDRLRDVSGGLADSLSGVGHVISQFSVGLNDTEQAFLGVMQAAFDGQGALGAASREGDHIAIDAAPARGDKTGTEKFLHDISEGLEVVFSPLGKAMERVGELVMGKETVAQAGASGGVQAGIGVVQHEAGHIVDKGLSRKGGTFNRRLALTAKASRATELASEGITGEDADYKMKTGEVYADTFAMASDNTKAFMAEMSTEGTNVAEAMMKAADGIEDGSLDFGSANSDIVEAGNKYREALVSATEALSETPEAPPVPESPVPEPPVAPPVVPETEEPAPEAPPTPEPPLPPPPTPDPVPPETEGPAPPAPERPETPPVPEPPVAPPVPPETEEPPTAPKTKEERLTIRDSKMD